MADPTRQTQSPLQNDNDRRSNAELTRQTIEATSGGGLVRVKLDGHGNLRSLFIAPEAFDGRDADLLADLITAAITEAQRRLDDRG